MDSPANILNRGNCFTISMIIVSPVMILKSCFFVGLMFAISGCSIPGLGRCDTDFVEVTMINGILSTTPPHNVNLSSRISEDNIPADFAALSAVVRSAATDHGPDELLWDLSQGLPSQGFAGFSLVVPVNQGRVFTLAGPAFQGAGGWGVRSQQPPEPARAGLQLGSFKADTVSGTIVVIATSPLGLRINLQFADETQTIGLSGDMHFRTFTVTETCD
jgi:hypothetical protein